MSGTNADQRDFWSARAGPIWVAQMDAMDRALAPVLDGVLARAAIAPGERVIDVGCGAGTSTLQAAEAAGPDGAAHGLDISDTLLRAANGRASANTTFLKADAQTHAFQAGDFDVLISRFGVMFFDDSVAAFSNLRRSLAPDGRLVFAAWGAIPENPYFTLPARVAKSVIGAVPKSDPDGPGPFAFRDPSRISEILSAAGFDDIDVSETPVTLTPPGDAKEVATLMCEIGPAQAALAHFESDDADRARLIEAIAEALQEHETVDGIRLPALINFATARNRA